MKAVHAVECETPTCCVVGTEAVREAEFLVKWVGKSHAHNEWVAESVMARLAKRKLANFKRRHGAQPCCLAEECWSVPERLVARRPSPTGPGWEVLVKWTGLGYEHSTWEVRDPSFLFILAQMLRNVTVFFETGGGGCRACPAEKRLMNAANSLPWQSHYVH